MVPLFVSVCTKNLEGSARAHLRFVAKHWIRGIHSTVAIRITDHALLRLLCDGLECPIVSTSANRAGGATARNQLQMRKQFGGELDFIVSGFSPGSGMPSEIKLLTSGATLRSSA